MPEACLFFAEKTSATITLPADGVQIRLNPACAIERLAKLGIRAFWFFVGALGTAFVLAHLQPTDSTDPAGGRSGMRPHIDAATGCEYLSVQGGGITPRLTAEGKQMGCRP